ncbi:unnamed protein product [Ceutorhynchus assimilis]|uniref:ZAD domain-containing protein n=1 Tax=Ceutorhynchus assimilis TaxID=467358 RepID=A0A9N9MN30_9CUCU|nr:unnamed protein product [Ceutorhynchus assimilis]
MEVCRLCLKLLTGSFYKLEESYKKIINDLIPEVNLEISSDPVICTQCLLSIDELYTFKMLYSQNEQQLKHKIKDLVGPKLSEQEILQCQHSPEKTKERLCRTCLKCIENNAFTVLKPSCCDAYLESMLQTCLPDLDLDISQDPVMCEKCFNFLQKFHNLKSVCQEVEEKLKKYHPENSLIDLYNVVLEESLPKTTTDTNNDAVNVKNELLDDINDVINGLDDSEDFSNIIVKQEEIDIKLEE